MTKRLYSIIYGAKGVARRRSSDLLEQISPDLLWERKEQKLANTTQWQQQNSSHTAIQYSSRNTAIFNTATLTQELLDGLED